MGTYHFTLLSKTWKCKYRAVQISDTQSTLVYDQLDRVFSELLLQMGRDVLGSLWTRYFLIKAKSSEQSPFWLETILQKYFPRLKDTYYHVFAIACPSAPYKSAVEMTGEGWICPSLGSGCWYRHYIGVAHKEVWFERRGCPWPLKQ